MSASNPPLSPEQIEDRLEDLPGWVVNASGKLLCEFQFPDFRAAFRFMTLAADRAEELNHHPEWFNVYNRVRVELTTHDADGITELDFALATSMNSYAEQPRE